MKKIKLFLLGMLAVVSMQQIALSMSRKDALDALGLQEGATENQIKKAYLKLIAPLHPDKQVGKDEREKQIAADNFEKISKAKAMLEKGSQAQKWVAERANAWKDAEGKDQKGFTHWATKWLNNKDNQDAFKGNQEAFWDFIELNDKEGIKTAINDAGTYDKETLKEEITKLAQQIFQTMNPQANKQEEERKAELARQEAERKKREEAERKAQEDREKAERQREEERERIERQRKDDERKAELARKAAEELRHKEKERAKQEADKQERIRREEAEHKAQEEALRKQEEERQDHAAKEINERAQHEQNEAQGRDNLARELKAEQERIRREAQTKNNQPHPEAKKIVTCALELAACLPQN